MTPQPDEPFPFFIEAVLDMVGETIPVTEEIVTLALQAHMSGAITDKEHTDIQRWADVLACARTGGIFSLDSDDLPVIDPRGYYGNDLPPLPFPRIWIEVNNGGRYEPIAHVTDLDGKPETVGAFAIFEENQGQLWRVIIVFLPRSLDQWALREYEITPTLIVHPHDPNDITNPSDADWLYSTMTQAPIAFGHVLTLLGLEYRPAPILRAHRRRFERRHAARGWHYPTVYRIDLSQAGETLPHHGERQYHVRWIVRGHWRLCDGGSTFIREKGGLCSWVRPYVKGPKGAPWKGRPIYVTTEAA